MENFIAFVRLVQEMRNQQRRYFKERSYAALQQSKALERRVDDAAAELVNEVVNGQDKKLLIEYPD